MDFRSLYQRLQAGEFASTPGWCEFWRTHRTFVTPDTFLGWCLAYAHQSVVTRAARGWLQANRPAHWWLRPRFCPAQPIPLPLVVGEPAVVATFTEEGRILGAGSAGVLWLADPATGACRARLQAPGPAVGVDSVQASGARAITLGRDQTVRWWDLRTGHFRGLLGGCSGAAFLLPDGRRAAVSRFTDETVAVWDLDPVQRLATFTFPTGISAVASRSADEFLVGLISGEIYALALEPPGNP